jgi:DNA-binding MarR family transcriptional regulator
MAETVWLSLARAHDYGNARLTAFLREYGLTPQQYNILRILRGAGETGLSCSAIAERMITRDPDITRLADRLEKRGLIGRRRSPSDRRAVVLALEPAGLELLDQIGEPLASLHGELMALFSEQEAAELERLLDRFRAAQER